MLFMSAARNFRSYDFFFVRIFFGWKSNLPLPCTLLNLRGMEALGQPVSELARGYAQLFSLMYALIINTPFL